MTVTALSKKFYPVIHCPPPRQSGWKDQVFKNVRIAMENGSDGVFLIGHEMHPLNLIFVYECVREEFPGIWVGINFLDIAHNEDWKGLSSITRSCQNLNALWIDGMPGYRLDLPLNIQVFGGVAFKYIASDLVGDALTAACEAAVRTVDVATTSGEATGSPPSIEKLRAIKDALDGRIPLALARGVNESNVAGFKDDVDIFLVASSICEKSAVTGIEYFVPHKVARLGYSIHSR